MKAYYVKYRLFQNSEIKAVDFLARNKEDAYDKAAFRLIPLKEGKYPYSVWVESVTYNNGSVHYFKTGEGFPY